VASSRNFCDTARKKQQKPGKSDNEGKKNTNRHVDAWRPVFNWDITEIWDIIEQHSINPHPCYRLGWGRCSCAGCIFSKQDQFASLKIVDPSCFNQIARYEEEFGHTIKFKVTQKNYVKTYIYIPLLDYAKTGKPFKMNPFDVMAVNSTTFEEPVFLRHWNLPKGAYEDQSTGPS